MNKVVKSAAEALALKATPMKTARPKENLMSVLRPRAIRAVPTQRGAARAVDTAASACAVGG